MVHGKWKITTSPFLYGLSVTITFHFPIQKTTRKVLHGPLHRAAQMQLLQDLVAIDALEAPQGQQLHRAATRRHDTMTRAAMELADLADLKNGWVGDQRYPLVNSHIAIENCHL